MARKKHDVFYPDRVEGGKLITRPVLQLLRELEGQQVEVCIRPKRYYVTHKQHGYYRACVLFMVAEEARGHGATGLFGGPITDAEVHELLAAKFLRVSVCINVETGECLDIIRSTASLTTAEMSDFIENVKNFAAEQYGIQIPEAAKQLAFV